MKLKIIFIFLGITIFSIAGYFTYSLQSAKPVESENKITEPLEPLKEQISKDDHLKITSEKDQEISSLKSQKQALEKQITDLNTRMKSIESEISLKDKEISALKKTNSKNNDKLEDLSNKVNCQELIKKTPDRGPGIYIGNNIEKFYKSSIESLNSIKDNPDDPEESVEGRKFWQDIIDEAKPMYDNYMKKCK